MFGLRDGREGPLPAVHVHIAVVAVYFHVKSAAVAPAFDQELELVALVPIGVCPLWDEDRITPLQFKVTVNTNQICQVCLQFH